MISKILLSLIFGFLISAYYAVLVAYNMPLIVKGIYRFIYLTVIPRRNL